MKKFLSIFAFCLILSSLFVANTSAQTNTPVFQVLTPKTDQTLYGNKIPILFNVEKFELVDKDQTTKALAGEGHILVWLDQEAPTPENATKVVENTFIFSDVAYGQHTLKAELVTTNNKSLTPPQMTTVSFKTEILASEEAQAISSGFDKTTAVVILAVVALVILAAWWYTKDEDDELEKQETKNNKPKTEKKTIKKTTKTVKSKRRKKK